MPKKRQLVLTRSKRSSGEGPGLASMGSKRDVLGALARFNTAPDGSPRSSGMDVLHGPGMVLEVPSAAEEITQAMVTVTDEEIALPVLLRACKTLGWSMTDLDTGRSFG